ncbi:hypothetical protein, partial [Actinotalea sp. JY-7885]
AGLPPHLDLGARSQHGAAGHGGPGTQPGGHGPDAGRSGVADEVTAQPPATGDAPTNHLPTGRRGLDLVV